MSRLPIRSLSLAVASLCILACGNGYTRAADQSVGSAGGSPGGTSALAPPASLLGSAHAFSVLGGSTVTNTGPSSMDGNLGVSPGTALTGFPPGILLPPATSHSADVNALQAENDVTIAYNALAAAACTSDKTGVDLGGLTLTPGVYCFASEAQLTGTLVLDAKFDANAVFVFQTVSKLTTASGASIRLINGANPCNVFWKVGSSATIGTTSTFIGQILALTSIALQTGASLDGRALARNGAVTLDNNQIRSESCAVSGGGGSDGGPTAQSCCLGAVACDGVCTNLQNDANHCGGCGKSCSASEVCTGGACATCPASRTQCKDQCADLGSDPFNCGACGKVCGASQSCVAGSCGACAGTLCPGSGTAGTCVELSTDPANCGACGNACAVDQCCNAGSCGTRTATNAFCRQH
jgi:hypothetical protein